MMFDRTAARVVLPEVVEQPLLFFDLRCDRTESLIMFVKTLFFQFCFHAPAVCHDFCAVKVKMLQEACSLPPVHASTWSTEMDV